MERCRWICAAELQVMCSGYWAKAEETETEKHEGYSGLNESKGDQLS